MCVVGAEDRGDASSMYYVHVVGAAGRGDQPRHPRILHAHTTCTYYMLPGINLSTRTYYTHILHDPRHPSASRAYYTHILHDPQHPPASRAYYTHILHDPQHPRASRAYYTHKLHDPRHPPASRAFYMHILLILDTPHIHVKYCRGPCSMCV